MNKPLTCLFCGELESVEILEIWPDGEFSLGTCCYELHEEIVHNMQDDPEYRAWLLKHCEVEGLTGSKLRRIPDHDGQFLLDFNLQVKPVEFAIAKEFVAKYHKHNKAPVGWKYGASIWNGTNQIGVAMVGRPVARAIDSTKVVEVNRLCIRRNIPKPLAWNACSQLYGWAAREAQARGFEKIITYTLETEAGTALKAAGWIPEAKTKGGSWNTPSRGRKDTAPTCRKVRWARYLVADKAA